MHGTINDLATAGAQPLCLSLAFILEEGLEIDVLRSVVESIGSAAAAAGVMIATGDTKVVPRGKADRLFINTSGIGSSPKAFRYRPRRSALAIRCSSVARSASTASP